MVVESNPRPGARVIVYDINPDQLAWSRYLVTQAGRHATLDDVERGFLAARPDVRSRATLEHERANAEAQARWYAANRRLVVGTAARVDVTFVTVDLLISPGSLLAWLRPDRTAFLMYLDLFAVWHVMADPPWIAHLPAVAAALEREVQRRVAEASFLPGPGSDRLQLAASPLAHSSRGGNACTLCRTGRTEPRVI